MKRKKDDEMVQTAVRLPQSLRDRLSKDGGTGGLGEEIRCRLEASFDAERAPANAKTRELLDAISTVAAETTRYYGWDKFAFEVLRECVNMLLAHYEPKGEAVPNPDRDSAADLLFGPEHSLKAISRTIVSGWISDRAKRGFADRQKG